MVGKPAVLMLSLMMIGSAMPREPAACPALPPHPLSRQRGVVQRPLDARRAALRTGLRQLAEKVPSRRGGAGGFEPGNGGIKIRSTPCRCRFVRTLMRYAAALILALALVTASALAPGTRMAAMRAIPASRDSPVHAVLADDDRDEPACLCGGNRVAESDQAEKETSRAHCVCEMIHQREIVSVMHRFASFRAPRGRFLYQSFGRLAKKMAPTPVPQRVGWGLKLQQRAAQR